MNTDFEKVIEREIMRALPIGYGMMPDNKLLGRFPYKIRYAFHSLKRNGCKTLINVFVLPSNITLDENIESQIIQLRNYIISKGCMFIVICEDDGRHYMNDTAIFVLEQLDLYNSNYFSLICNEDDSFKVTLDRDNYENISSIIHDIWAGKLTYYGADIGQQIVNLEVMRDECWKCHALMKTVTGIVIPNKKLLSWDNPYWSYFNHMVPICELNDIDIEQIIPVVERIRCREPFITPIEYRYSQTANDSYWTAICPHCGALRGAFYIEEDRRNLALTLDSRINHSLEYFSFEMIVRQTLLNKIGKGWEDFPCTCMMEWKR